MALRFLVNITWKSGIGHVDAGLREKRRDPLELRNAWFVRVKYAECRV